MDLMKFGLCVVTWILCASETKGDIRSNITSEVECVVGQDIPQIGPCSQCTCVEEKIVCADIECDPEITGNATSSGPKIDSFHKNIRPPEDVSTESTTPLIITSNIELNKNEMPQLPPVYKEKTVMDDEKQIPNIPMTLTDTHVENVLDTILGHNDDNDDKYVLIVPGLPPKSINPEKRDGSLADTQKNDFNEQFYGVSPLALGSEEFEIASRAHKSKRAYSVIMNENKHRFTRDLLSNDERLARHPFIFGRPGDNKLFTRPKHNMRKKDFIVQHIKNLFSDWFNSPQSMSNNNLPGMKSNRYGGGSKFKFGAQYKNAFSSSPSIGTKSAEILFDIPDQSFSFSQNKYNPNQAFGSIYPTTINNEQSGSTSDFERYHLGTTHLSNLIQPNKQITLLLPGSNLDQLNYTVDGKYPVLYHNNKYMPKPNQGEGQPAQPYNSKNSPNLSIPPYLPLQEGANPWLSDLSYDQLKPNKALPSPNKQQNSLLIYPTPSLPFALGNKNNAGQGLPNKFAAPYKPLEGNIAQNTLLPSDNPAYGPLLYTNPLSNKSQIRNSMKLKPGQSWPITIPFDPYEYSDYLSDNNIFIPVGTSGKPQYPNPKPGQPWLITNQLDPYQNRILNNPLDNNLFGPGSANYKLQMQNDNLTKPAQSFPINKPFNPYQDQNTDSFLDNNIFNLDVSKNKPETPNGALPKPGQSRPISKPCQKSNPDSPIDNNIFRPLPFKSKPQLPNKKLSNPGQFRPMTDSPIDNNIFRPLPFKSKPQLSNKKLSNPGQLRPMTKLFNPYQNQSPDNPVDYNINKSQNSNVKPSQSRPMSNPFDPYQYQIPDNLLDNDMFYLVSTGNKPHTLNGLISKPGQSRPTNHLFDPYQKPNPESPLYDNIFGSVPSNNKPQSPIGIFPEPGQSWLISNPFDPYQKPNPSGPPFDNNKRRPIRSYSKPETAKDALRKPSQSWPTNNPFDRYPKPNSDSPIGNNVFGSLSLNSKPQMPNNKFSKLGQSWTIPNPFNQYQTQGPDYPVNTYEFGSISSKNRIKSNKPYQSPSMTKPFDQYQIPDNLLDYDIFDLVSTNSKPQFLNNDLPNPSEPMTNQFNSYQNQKPNSHLDNYVFGPVPNSNKPQASNGMSPNPSQLWPMKNSFEPHQNQFPEYSFDNNIFGLVPSSSKPQTLNGKTKPGHSWPMTNPIDQNQPPEYTFDNNIFGSPPNHNKLQLLNPKPSLSKPVSNLFDPYQTQIEDNLLDNNVFDLVTTSNIPENQPNSSQSWPMSYLFSPYQNQFSYVPVLNNDNPHSSNDNPPKPELSWPINYQPDAYQNQFPDNSVEILIVPVPANTPSEKKSYNISKMFSNLFSPHQTCTPSNQNDITPSEESSFCNYIEKIFNADSNLYQNDFDLGPIDPQMYTNKKKSPLNSNLPNRNNESIKPNAQIPNFVHSNYFPKMFFNNILPVAFDEPNINSEYNNSPKSEKYQILPNQLGSSSQPVKHASELYPDNINQRNPNINKKSINEIPQSFNNVPSIASQILAFKYYPNRPKEIFYDEPEMYPDDKTMPFKPYDLQKKLSLGIPHYSQQYKKLSKNNLNQRTTTRTKFSTIKPKLIFYYFNLYKSNKSDNDYFNNYPLKLNEVPKLQGKGKMGLIIEYSPKLQSENKASPLFNYWLKKQSFQTPNEIYVDNVDSLKNPENTSSKLQPIHNKSPLSKYNSYMPKDPFNLIPKRSLDVLDVYLDFEDIISENIPQKYNPTNIPILQPSVKSNQLFNYYHTNNPTDPFYPQQNVGSKNYLDNKEGFEIYSNLKNPVNYPQTNQNPQKYNYIADSNTDYEHFPFTDINSPNFANSESLQSTYALPDLAFKYYPNKPEKIYNQPPETTTKKHIYELDMYLFDDNIPKLSHFSQNNKKPIESGQQISGKPNYYNYGVNEPTIFNDKMFNFAPENYPDKSWWQNPNPSFNFNPYIMMASYQNIHGNSGVPNIPKREILYDGFNNIIPSVSELHSRDILFKKEDGSISPFNYFKPSIGVQFHKIVIKPELAKNKVAQSSQDNKPVISNINVSDDQSKFVLYKPDESGPHIHEASSNKNSDESNTYSHDKYNAYNHDESGGNNGAESHADYKDNKEIIVDVEKDTLPTTDVPNVLSNQSEVIPGNIIINTETQPLSPLETNPIVAYPNNKNNQISNIYTKVRSEPIISKKFAYATFSNMDRW